jgi:hypothetical protein
MALSRGVRIACVLGLILGTAGGPEPGAAQTLPQSADDALHTMSQAAGVIFAGRVVAVRRHEGLDGSTGLVEIEFAVDDAVRGVSGSSYTVREWAGLWPAGDEPFRVGQRLLILLYAPSAAGLSSPVGGMDGAIPIHAAGQTSAQTATAMTPEVAARVAAGEETAPAVAATPVDGWVIDLRWVATRAYRPVSYRMETVARPTVLGSLVHSNALAVGRGQSVMVSSLLSAEVAAPVDGAGATLAAGAGGETYTTVIGMLQSWEKEDHGAR